VIVGDFHAYIQTFRATMIAEANNRSLPAIYPARQFVADGGLMSYGPNLPSLFEQIAAYLVAVLRGLTGGGGFLASSLPWSSPAKFELCIKSNHALAANLPQHVKDQAELVT